MQAPLALTPGRGRLDRDLGAVAGLAGDRRDLDGAVGDLGHLEREQLLDQVGVGARQRDLRAAHALADRDHQALDPGAVVVASPPGTRSPSGSSASSLPRSTITSSGLRPCWMTPGDDVALLAGELPEPDVVLGVAQPLQHDLLRGRRGDPAEARRACRRTRRPCCPRRRPRRRSTVTWPVLRSSSTRACSCAPGVLWYAVSRACSIASTSTSKEISFSRSSIRRMLRSMSISASFALGAVELDLHQRLVDVGVGDLAAACRRRRARPRRRRTSTIRPVTVVAVGERRP